MRPNPLAHCPLFDEGVIPGPTTGWILRAWFDIGTNQVEYKWFGERWRAISLHPNFQNLKHEGTGLGDYSEADIHRLADRAMTWMSEQAELWVERTPNEYKKRKTDMSKVKIEIVRVTYDAVPLKK